MSAELPAPFEPADVDVFEFLSVRAYLKAYYEAKKGGSRAFSYRAFSRRVGVRSPNHLKRIIDGERTLTEPMAAQYAAAIGLADEARDYFLDMCAFARAETLSARKEAFDRLLSYRRVRQARRLELAHAAYHSTWYVPAVRELIQIPGFKEDPAWIARTMVPPISEEEASDALDILETLGLVGRDPDGTLVVTDAILTTGAETRGMHIGVYHRAMMARAAASIDLVDRTERDISSLTFACDEATLHHVKERLVQFRKELIGELSLVTAPDRVVQLNLQLFPLTRPGRSR